MPDMRHGARTSRRWCRGSSEHRTSRHAATVFRFDRACHHRVPDGHVRFASGYASGSRVRRARCRLDRVRAGDARRALGRLAVLRARVGVAGEPQPEHVHARSVWASASPMSTASWRSSCPTIFPDSFRDDGGVVAVYFEAAAVIITLVLLGQVLELGARSETSAAIRALLASRAEDGPTRRRRWHGTKTCCLDAVAIGDRLRVRPGEKSAGRRRRRRGQQLRGRIDDHRRVDARREATRGPCDRRQPSTARARW